MKWTMVLSLVFCCPLIAQAADLPEVINANNANTLQTCVDNATNDCVNSNCMNSPDRNCPQNCQVAAQNKCNAMSQ